MYLFVCVCFFLFWRKVTWDFSYIQNEKNKELWRLISTVHLLTWQHTEMRNNCQNISKITSHHWQTFSPLTKKKSVWNVIGFAKKSILEGMGKITLIEVIIYLFTKYCKMEFWNQTNIHFVKRFISWKQLKVSWIVTNSICSLWW